MKYWNYWLLFVLIVIFIGFYLYQNREGFEDFYRAYNSTFKYSNDSDNIRDRHPVHETLIQNLNFKHKMAYNYELENDLYEKALYRTFELNKPTCLVKQDYTEEEPLNRVTPEAVTNAYKEAISTIQAKIKESSHFDLPDGTLQTLNPIQMVHDYLLAYRTHKTIPEHYLLYIDTILYREGKYHGKNVMFTVLAEKAKGWNIRVLDAKVKGMVMEDQIALFPVEANDVYNTNINLSTAEYLAPRYSNRIFDVTKSEYTAEQLKGLSNENIVKLRSNPVF